MSKLLDSLIAEYNELKQKLEKLTELIHVYGGVLPIDDPVDGRDDLRNFKSMSESDRRLYPLYGSWKQKILCILLQLHKPSTAKEISNEIIELESLLNNPSTVNSTQIHNTVTQYTSTMASKGEIGVDSSEYRNKYYLLD